MKFAFLRIADYETDDLPFKDAAFLLDETQVDTTMEKRIIPAGTRFIFTEPDGEYLELVESDEDIIVYSHDFKTRYPDKLFSSAPRTFVDSTGAWVHDAEAGLVMMDEYGEVDDDRLEEECPELVDFARKNNVRFIFQTL